MSQAKVGDIWIRYEDKLYSVVVDPDREEFSTEQKINRLEYAVVRVTEKGVWLARKFGERIPTWPEKGNKIFSFQPRFQLFQSIRKFACPTEELARKSFIARKNKQASIFRNRMQLAENAIKQIEGKSLLGLPFV